jgi:heat shock protein HslJ
MQGSRMRGVVAALVLLAACQPVSTEQPPLFGVEWQLVELKGQPAPLGNGGRPGTLLLAEGEGRASGFAGCNRFSGTFTVTGDQLQFGPLMMTKMACSEGMDLEASYPAALDGSSGFRVTVRIGVSSATAADLELLSGTEVVARFTRP